MNFKIQLPSEIKYVLEKLNSNEFEAFAVGGCVRDSIMGNIPNDWDVCTSAKPDKISEIFKSHKTIDIGIKHGTVAVIVDGKIIEITTYRIDGDYTDSRHPDRVEFTPLLKEDLRRRDFTVNAMAYNPQIGIVDCFDGTGDIKNKILRCVGDPHKRFKEDALRILRALRFSSKLDFEIEKKTQNAMFDLKHLLNRIAPERIRCELDGILMGKNAFNVISEYSKIIQVFLPAFESLNFDEFYGDINLRRILFFSEIGNAEKNMSKLRYSNADIATVTSLENYKNIELDANDITIKKLLRNIGEKNLSLLLHLKYPDGDKKIEHLIEKCSKECYRISDLAINGNDLLKLGFIGKDIKTELERLLELVITNELKNEKQILLENVRSVL